MNRFPHIQLIDLNVTYISKGENWARLIASGQFTLKPTFTLAH